MTFDGTETRPMTEVEIVELEKHYKQCKQIQYRLDRMDSYPSYAEQLDMQYWDKVNGTNKWQEAVTKVKSDHPKPE